jgi:hypothetical protein
MPLVAVPRRQRPLVGRAFDVADAADVWTSAGSVACPGSAGERQGTPIVLAPHIHFVRPLGEHRIETLQHLLHLGIAERVIHADCAEFECG